ncbi:colicin V production protein [Thioploca ingrica]|uniref:Colicin V production protein n=1 Tax=Thioploca ingrica TaxID=40754 RepID=A0A090AJA2_9GAMM|nr:colicin V production protein [Thioploca ingrica]
MNWADVGIIVIILLLGMTSFLQGLVKELLSLLAWLCSFTMALFFLDDLARLLEIIIPFADLRLGVALITLFLLTLILLEWISYLVINSMKSSQLSLPDQFIGMLFGIIKGNLVIILFMMCAGVTQLPMTLWWQKSFFIQTNKPIVILLRSQLPIEIAIQFNFDPAPEQNSLAL